MCDVKAPKVDLSAANGAKMNVTGVVNAHINATSTSGEQFHTTTKVYVVSNVDECYLSCDVLRGLKIIDNDFPEAGGRHLNQHGNNNLGWDRTGTVVECLPFASYQLRMDGSGRVAKKTYQHLQVFDSLNVPPEAPAPRRPPEQRQQHNPIQPPPEGSAPVNGTFEPPEAAPAAVEQELLVEDAPPPAPAPIRAPPRVDQGVENERQPPAKRAHPPEVPTTPRRSDCHPPSVSSGRWRGFQ